MIDGSFHHSKDFEEVVGSAESSYQQEPSSKLEHADPEGLPPFILPLPESLDSADKAFLQAKGALQIPPPDLRNSIINCYLQYIHPLVPLLDTYTLIQITRGFRNPQKPLISILLFQAVMFSAVHLVDAQAIRKAGFDTPRDARRAFYGRALVRMMFSTTSSPISDQP